MNHCKAVFLVVIAGRKGKDALLHALSEAGMKLVNTTYGRGTMQASYLESVLGLIPEEHKVVLTGLVPRERVCPLFDMLREKFGFDKPNTGIAFTIPIDTLFVPKREDKNE